MNEEEKKAIELLEDIRNNSWTTKYIMSSDSKNAEVLLNLIEKMKNCINILDDELKERNKTINEKEIIIGKLQKENEELKNIELKSKGGAIKISLYGILSLENKIKQLEKENKELELEIKNREFLHMNFSYFPALLIFGLGVITGIISIIKLIRICLEKYRSQTIYAIIGLMLGSLLSIIQGPTTLDVPQEAMSLQTFNIVFFFFNTKPYFKKTYTPIKNNNIYLII